MKTQVRLVPLALALMCAVPAALLPMATPAAAEAAAAPAKGASVSPEIMQALDAVYLAAHEAETGTAQGAAAAKSYQHSALGGPEQAAKSTRDPVSQMVAMGLGVAAGLLAINWVTGGAGASRFYTMTSAMMGGMLGDYIYRKHYAPPLPSIPASISQRISP